jgi:hypothetical protein
MNDTFLGLALINEWYTPWIGQVKRKMFGGNHDIFRRMSMVYLYVLG